MRKSPRFPKRVRSTDGSRVPDDESVEVTVADYFEKEKNLKLKFPLLPALDVGKASKAVYLPIEVWCRCLSLQPLHYCIRSSGVLYSLFRPKLLMLDNSSLTS